MAKLYDHKLGTGVLVADERVNELISTGNYSFIKGSSVHVVDEGGELYEVPPENAREALEAGYTYAPEEVVTEGLLRKEIEETQRYGKCKCKKPGSKEGWVCSQQQDCPWSRKGSS